MPDLVIGAGEVGSALGEALQEGGRTILYIDPGKGMDIVPGTKIQVMNIAFPYSDSFVGIAADYIKQHKPKLVIIHSTVEVGTTQKVEELTKRPVAYSFIRGRHEEGLHTLSEHFKHIGCSDEATLNQAISYLVDAGFNVGMCFSDPKVVELQKLLDTTYYGVCIAYTKMAKSMADHYQLDWDEIQEANRTYNQGVLLVGRPEWVRPELEPTPGPIGGHCIVPNIRILKQTFTHKLLDAVEEAK